MRRARLLVGEGCDGLYHVVSRVVDKQMLFGEVEKRHFVRLMKAYAAFGGLRLVSWVVMGNHFHILVEVPVFDPASLTPEELLRRLAFIHGPTRVAEVRAELAACRGAASCRQIIDRYAYRMGDLGEFMKTLKQRFTQWLNRKRKRVGTLWEDRYRSVVVEGAAERGAALGHAARVVGAYIDLNPVRAGIVKDPADYRWSSYGAAAGGGDSEAMAGLRRLWGKGSPDALAAQRLMVFEEGSEERVPEDGEKSGRAGIDAARVWRERKRGGRLPLAVMLRLRVRYLTAGGVVGSRAFVDEVWRGSPGVGPGGNKGAINRNKTVRPMRFGEWGGLHVLRALRVDVVGGGG